MKNPINYPIMIALFLLVNISKSYAQNNFGLTFDSLKSTPQLISIQSLVENNNTDFSIETNSNTYKFISDSFYVFNKTSKKTKKLAETNFGNFLIMKFPDRAKFIFLAKAKFQKISISSSTWFSASNLKGNFLALESFNNDRIYFDDSQIDTLLIGGSSLGHIYCSEMELKRIQLIGDTINSKIDFIGSTMPKSIELNSLVFIKDGEIDLSNFNYTTPAKCQLDLSSVEMSKINFNYALYDIKLERDVGKKESFYKQLLDNQNKYGYKDGYQRADIEFRSLENEKKGLYGNLLNILQAHWNNFGYNKEYIFRIGFLTFLITYVLNLFCYFSLVNNAYTIPEFKKANSQLINHSRYKRVIYYLIYCLLYTGIVFWGLRISIDKIKFSKGDLAIWIIIQYIVGLIIIAFIANVVIGK
jgi:hypothetical protein